MKPWNWSHGGGWGGGLEETDKREHREIERKEGERDKIQKKQTLSE